MLKWTTTAQLHTHTHTHTYIHIYIYIYIKSVRKVYIQGLSGENERLGVQWELLANASFPGLEHSCEGINGCHPRNAKLF